MENADTAMMEIGAAFQRGIAGKTLTPQARDYGVDWLRARMTRSKVLRWNPIRARAIARAERLGRTAAANSNSNRIDRDDLKSALDNMRRGPREDCPF